MSQDKQDKQDKQDIRWYLSQLTSYNKCGKKEEEEKFKRYLEGETGFFEELILNNLTLVVSIAKRYLYTGIPFLELIQEGNVGLLKILSKYDPEKYGTEFSTIATLAIKSSIRLYLRKRCNKDYLYLNDYINPNLDSNTSFDNLLFKLIGKEKATVEYSFSDLDTFKEKFKEKLSSILTEKEFFVFTQEIVEDSGLGPKALGEILGLSRERARQLRDKALYKIRSNPELMQWCEDCLR